MAARNDKDPNKVAYGRRNAEKENISQGHLVYPKPGTQSVPETAKFSGTLSVPTGPGTLSVPTSDTLGRGWGRGRVVSEEARARHETERRRDADGEADRWPDEVINLPDFLPRRNGRAP
jgi:hypothetical protein